MSDATAADGMMDVWNLVKHIQNDDGRRVLWYELANAQELRHRLEAIKRESPSRFEGGELESTGNESPNVSQLEIPRSEVSRDQRGLQVEHMEQEQMHEDFIPPLTAAERSPAHNDPYSMNRVTRSKKRNKTAKRTQKSASKCPSHAHTGCVKEVERETLKAEKSEEHGPTTTQQAGEISPTGAVATPAKIATQRITSLVMPGNATDEVTLNTAGVSDEELGEAARQFFENFRRR